MFNANRKWAVAVGLDFFCGLFRPRRFMALFVGAVQTAF